MDYYKIVEKMCKSKGIGITHLGLRLGHTAAYVAKARTRGSLPQVDTASKTAAVCDYTLCAIPKDDVPEDAYVIDPSK